MKRRLPSGVLVGGVSLLASLCAQPAAEAAITSDGWSGTTFEFDRFHLPAVWNQRLSMITGL